MNEEKFTEVSYTSWGQRIKDSITGILMGLLFFLCAFPLLFWNEGRAVNRYKTLKEGASSVISISPDKVQPSNEGRLVHVSGRCTTEETLSDPELMVSVNAIKLKRIVEMYQWKETSETRTEKQVGGKEKETTTYTYSKVWSSREIPSSGFKQSGYHNPGSMPFASAEYTADLVHMGAFQLSQNLIQKINAYKPFPINRSNNLPAGLGNRGQIYGSGFYIGMDPSSPEIGDVKITYQMVPPLTVSLVAGQSDNSFTPYQTNAGGTIELLQTGAYTADQMFQKSRQTNTIVTWLIRLGGFLLMLMGLNLIFKPLSVLADVIPLAGSLVGTGTGMIAFLLSIVLSSATIAIAWIVYRPVFGISLLVVSAGITSFVVIKGMKNKAQLPPVPSAAPSMSPRSSSPASSGPPVPPVPPPPPSSGPPPPPPS